MKAQSRGGRVQNIRSGQYLMSPTRVLQPRFALVWPKHDE